VPSGDLHEERRTGRDKLRRDAGSPRSATDNPVFPGVPTGVVGRALADGWFSGLQRQAGNLAVTEWLRGRQALQRADPAVADAPRVDAPVDTSREPSKQERDEWGSYFPDTEFRILRPSEVGYNCFAWAVGLTTKLITSDTLMQANYTADLTGWTKYLAAEHGFRRSSDGLDGSADLILYGETPATIWHAARKADVAYRQMTFSSKLGDGRSPVILHAPADIQGKQYGKAQRSFWRS
jgi:hypothetical protein